MASVNGSDYLIYVSSDGTSMGTMNALEFQGDLSISFNRQLDTVEFKNDQSHTAVNNGYISGQAQIGNEAPVPTALGQILTAHDNRTPVYLQIKSAVTGAVQWVGTFRVTLSDIAMNVQGPSVINFQFSQDGTVTRGTTS